MTRSPVRLALVAGAVVLAAALLVVGSQRDYRLLGSNRVPAAALRVKLDDRSRTFCQRTLVPGGTGGVRLVAASGGGPRPALRATIDGRPAGQTGLGEDGWVRIPIHTVTATRPNAKVCVTAAGHMPVRFGAFVARPRVDARDEHGRVLGAVVRLEFVTPTRQSWWSALGGTARRFGYGKPGWEGGWTLVLVGLLGLGALAAAAWALLGRQPE